MSDKFLAVVKLKTSEEVLAQIEMSPQGDVMSLDTLQWLESHHSLKDLA